MTTTQTALINRLRALLLTGNDSDRELARAALIPATLQRIAWRRSCRTQGIDETVRRQEARRLARAIQSSREELASNRTQLHDLVKSNAPSLLALTGVGPVSAAQVLVSWSHPGRCRNEAAFAALAGACPIPASSGRRQRHRLNRGGDRHLNRALHDILLTRWRICPRTHAYIARRRSEGRTDAEIRRCLKRYLVRELYRTLNTPST
jgi:transposase